MSWPTKTFFAMKTFSATLNQDHMPSISLIGLMANFFRNGVDLQSRSKKVDAQEEIVHVKNSSQVGTRCIVQSSLYESNNIINLLVQKSYSPTGSGQDQGHKAAIGDGLQGQRHH